MADKTFVMLVGNATRDPQPAKNKPEILEFGLAVNQGYGDDAPPAIFYNINAWPNTRDDRGDFQAWIKENVSKGSKGIYIEGFMSERPSNNGGTPFRDVSPSRIGLVEYAERSQTAAAVGADDDDF